MEGVLNVGRGYKKILAAAMAGLGATIGVLLLTGKLFAAFPLAGIGGFVLTAPDLSGTGFALTPSLTQTDVQGGWPAGMVNLQTVHIGNASNTAANPGFELTKHFDLTATPIGQVIPSADVVISAAKVTGSNLLLDTTGLQAVDAQFGTFNAAERYAINSSSHTVQGVEGSEVINSNNTPNAIDPTLQLGLTADTLNLTQAAINTDALKADSLDLASLRLAVQANAANSSSYGDFGYDTSYDTATPDAGGSQSAPPIPLVPGN